MSLMLEGGGPGGPTWAMVENMALRPDAPGNQHLGVR